MFDNARALAVVVVVALVALVNSGGSGNHLCLRPRLSCFNVHLRHDPVPSRLEGLAFMV